MGALRIGLWLLPLAVWNLSAATDPALEELRALKAAHLEILKRIEALETKLEAEGRLPKPETETAAAPKPKPAVETAGAATPAPSPRGTLELGSASTVLSVGGRIQLDTDMGWPEGSHFAGKIPLSKAGEDGQLGFSARESRLWVKTRTPSQYGMIRALIETDFKGSSGTETTTNSHGIRLRHAYVQIGPWTAGQTNSLFNAAVTMDTLYDAIDYTLVRQPLLSYGGGSKAWNWALSLEQPETTLLDPDGNLITPQDDRLPDLGMRLRWFPKWGEGGIAAMVRYIRQDRALLGSGIRTPGSDAATGWGVNAYGAIRLGSSDDLRFGAAYGEGIGRYLAYNAFPAGSVDATGKITLQESFGAHLGYRHWWHDTLRSTLAFSYAGTSNTGTATEVTDRSRSLQANLLWTPASRTLVGIEYARALRELENGEEGEMELLRMTLRYEF